MGHFVKLSMLLLLFFFLSDDLQAEDIKAIKGRNVTIKFSFDRKLNHSLTLKHANLHKNGTKIEEVNGNSTDSRRSFQLISHKPILSISNLTTSDAGEYFVSLYYIGQAGNLIESLRIVLHIDVEEHTTVSTPTYNHTRSVPFTASPHGSLISISIITGIVVSIMILFTVMLGWQYLSHNKSRDCQHPHQEQRPQASSPKCQVKREQSSSVEYNVLDFHRRPGGKEGDMRSSPLPQAQDSVEYSTITFFHGPPGDGGAVPPPRGQ